MDISFSPLSCQYPIAYLEAHVVRVMGGTEQRCHSKEKALPTPLSSVLLGGIKGTVSFLRVCKRDRIPTLFHPPGSQGGLSCGGGGGEFQPGAACSAVCISKVEQTRC